MARIALDRAYPGISFRPRSRNWLARLMHWPAECIHLENGHTWMATFIPDTLYLRGKAAPRRDTTRPEVSLCLDSQAALKQQGVEARVISMPSWELFEEQDGAYRESVLPASIRARVSVEKASRFGWERYVGLEGERIGMKTFGASAPLKELQKKFGFTADAVVSAALEQVNKAKSQ